MSLFQNKASGGMITGGSGTKDDVPAMLMGGEYVVKKKAVQKYGPEFLSAINNGTLGGYAKGGSVKKFTNQTGEGGYFLPGLYGNESVASQQGLFDFATQNYTSGARDVISSGENYASINLETESARLTQKGRENNPLFAATQSAKEQSLGLVFQETENWENYYKAVEEAKKQEKARQKAIRKQLIMSAAMAVVSAAAGPVLGAAGAGFKAAFGASKAASATNGLFTNIGAGLKGVFTGGQVGGQTVGGLGNLFAGVGKGLTGNFAEAGNFLKLSQIGDAQGLAKAYNAGISLDSNSNIIKSNFTKFLDNSGYTPRASIVNEGGIGVNGTNNWFSNIFSGAKGFLNFGQNINSNTEEKTRRATGGIIPPTSGIDTIPAMLSGGEFVMNKAATQNIGAGNLQALNSGGGSVVTEEKTEELNDKLISKLDELIQAGTSKSSVGEININVDGSGKSKESNSNVESGGQGQQLARNIRDMVVKVIQDEQRLGGLLR
jgi:hypothetical protein